MKVKYMILAAARKRTASQEILLWMTPSEAPKALQASECSELLDPTGASFWIFAQRQPGKLAQHCGQGKNALEQEFSACNQRKRLADPKKRDARELACCDIPPPTHPHTPPPPPASPMARSAHWGQRLARPTTRGLEPLRASPMG